MPTKARRRGERRRSVEIVLERSPEEERPTRVPRRVWRSWEGERETERREDGEPRISKVASVLTVSARLVMTNKNVSNVPGDEREVDLLSTTIVLLSVEGVACIVMRRRPGTGRVPWLKAAHCLGWFDRRCRPRRASSRMFAQAG